MSLAAALAPITLPDVDGKPYRLGALWAESPAAIVFLRHWGWIFCREHVAQLRDAEAKFRDKGVNVAAIRLGGLEYARQFREETRIAFPLLIDADTKVHKAAGLGKANLLHLLRSDNARARKRAKAAGHRQHTFGKDPFQLEHPFQLGGSFIFGPGNVDRFAHVSQTFGDNASMDDLLNAASA